MAPSTITTTYEEICDPSYFSESLNLVAPDHGFNHKKVERVPSKDSIHDILKRETAKIDVDSCQPGEENAFYVADLGEIYRQHQRWKRNLGRVKPFYGEWPRSF